jgi:hypothetical protein
MDERKLVTDADAGAVKPSGLTVNVVECPSCGGLHETCYLKSLKTPSPPWTHWFQCPVTKDPVMVTLDTKTTPPEEINNAIVRSLVRAQQSTRYLAAIFRMNEQNIVLERISYQFPTSFEQDGKTVPHTEALPRLLRTDLEKEAGPPAPIEPLKEATDIPQTIDLFGDKAKAEP